MRQLSMRAIIGLLCAFWAAFAAAHPMPESRVWIDTTPAGLRLTLQLPLNRLEYGFGQPLADISGTLLAQHGEALSRYLLQHVGARSGDTAWQAHPPQLEVVGNDASAELQAVLELRAPPGADTRSLTLRYDAITHEVRTHQVLVFLRNDWAAGHVGEAPLLLGELHHGLDTLQVRLGGERSGASIVQLLKAGAVHIATGTDHLLFLLLLVVVAPLAARHGRWETVREGRPAVRQIAIVVSAFTLGHSITLALGSLGWVSPPARLVEVAVAASIAIAALHALRPLRANGEIAMALGFGLVHGFAFSGSLSGAGLSAWQHAVALLAFNLGIEAMQIAVLLIALPPLLVLSRTNAGWYARLRRAVAAGAGGLATAWIAERLGLGAFAVVPGADDAAWLIPLAAVVFWAVALCARGQRRRRATAAPDRG